MKCFAVAAIVALVGCLDAPGYVCDDGTLCPDDATCASVGGRSRCVTDEQRVQCAGRTDGDLCMLGGQPVGVCHDEVCVRAGCGDGLVTGAEQCDGADLGADVDGDGAVDCRDLGFYTAGALACLPDCTFDRAGCTGAGACGDGVVNGDEECDGDVLPLGTACDAYSVSAGSSTKFHPGGEVACGALCTLSFAGCTGGFCGDAVKQANEACDGFDVGTATCAPYSGSATCNEDCTEVVYACAGSCGDGVVNGPERCDPGVTPHAMPLGLGCSTFGFHAGEPSCSADCGAIELAACTDHCGDGVIQGNEACDGPDQAGADCSAFGGRGALGCDAFCQRDFASCQTGGWQRRAQGFPMTILKAIWSQHGDAAFAVGFGYVLEWNGSAWIDHGTRPHAMLPAAMPWSAVWGDARYVWAAAHDSIYRYDPLAPTAGEPGVWVAEMQGGPGVFGLWGDGTVMYAATSNGVYRRTSLGTWEVDPATTGVPYYAIHGRGDTLVAAGPFGAIRKVGAGGWTMLSASGSWQHVSVWSSSTIWLASANHVAVYVERDGVSALRTAIVPPHLVAAGPPLVRGVFAAASDDVYVAAQTNVANVLLRWTGDHNNGAPLLAQVSIGTLPALGGLGGSGAGDVWLLASGATFHHDGQGWHAPTLVFEEPAPTLGAIAHTSVTVTSDRAWFGGGTASGSAIVAYAIASPVPPAATVISSSGPLFAMWASDDVLWYVIGNTINAYVEPPAVPPPGTTLSGVVSGAWGHGEHVFFAVDGHVVHFDGTTWSEETVASGGEVVALRALGGSSPTDVWAVGAEFTSAVPVAAIYHRNANGWHVVPAPAGLTRITAVWSAARDDAWAAAKIENGDLVHSALLHWDGVTWQEWPDTRLQIGEISSLWGSSPFDIWAVGTVGTVLHYDGRRWTPIPVPTFEHLRAVHGASADEVWVVGDNNARFKLTHRLPITSPGVCAGAVPLYCGDPTPTVGTVFGDTPAYYRFDAPALADVTDLALSVATMFDQGVELAVYSAASASDARCDIAGVPVAPAPLADPTTFSFEAAPATTYYIAVRRAPTSVAAANSYTLSATCTYDPDPNP